MAMSPGNELPSGVGGKQKDQIVDLLTESAVTRAGAEESSSISRRSAGTMNPGGVVAAPDG